jgi:sarcosine oxidase
MTESYDAIVVGGGAMGSAAARVLAGRKRHTLLLERYGFGNANGSSGGPTRIFRLTYHDAAYVRMARCALEHWRELEEAGGEPLLATTGGLDVGPGGRTSGEALSAAGEAWATVAPEALAERWPALSFPSGTEMFVQEDGGVCRAETTVLTQARLARAAGADVRDHTEVTAITPADEAVEVTTAAGDVARAPVAIVTAGPWASKLLATAGIDLPLTPSFEQATYARLDAPSSLPTVTDWRPHGAHPIYLVPDPFEPGEFKVGIHKSGGPVDADDRSFDPDPDRVATARAYTAAHVVGSVDAGRTDTCLYTNAPDEEFVIDRSGPIVVGSPCSGHGFKFVPLIGRVLADLATGDPPPEAVPMARFRMDRPGLR